MPHTWYLKIVKRTLEACGNNEQLMAEKLGVTRGAVRGWFGKVTEKPSIPNAMVIEKMVELLGGDLERALPAYDPVADVNARAIEYIKALKQENDLLKRRVEKIRAAVEQFPEQEAGLVADITPFPGL